MQVIQEYFDNTLEPIFGHVATKHALCVTEGRRLTKVLKNLSHVNAFHNLGATKTKGDLLLCASSFDGVIKAVEHYCYKVFGIMWHSEREAPFSESEQAIFKLIFNL